MASKLKKKIVGVISTSLKITRQRTAHNGSEDRDDSIRYMDLKNFRNFVDEIQRDPRLNETLYPKMSENQALDINTNYDYKVAKSIAEWENKEFI